MKLAVAVAVSVVLLCAVSVEAEDEMGPPVLDEEDRITTGSPAWPGQFPYMAYLRSTDAAGKMFTECAGTLVKEAAVLTAAWCVDGLKKYIVRLGSISRTGDDENAWTVVSEWAQKHPQYDKSSADYDVAIIFLPEKPPLYGNDIKVVDLPSSPSDDSYAGCQAVVSSWGRYSVDPAISDVLLWAKVVVVPNVFCIEALPNSEITDRQLCAAGSKPNAFGSDAGAPLLLKTEDRYVQIGVYSKLAPDSYNTHKPAVFTRVAAVVDWVHSATCPVKDQQMPGGGEE